MGTGGIEVGAGPWLYQDERLVVSMTATARCEDGNTEGRSWLKDVGSEGVWLSTESGETRYLVGGWGVAAQDAFLSCDVKYVGAWIFDLSGDVTCGCVD